MNLTIRDIFKDKNAHCGYCGGCYLENQPWPRKCLICSNESYLNPIPIAVSLIPVIAEGGYGILMIKRANEPSIGEWAFPGGYLELGETWQQGAAREIKEEVGLIINPNDLLLTKIENATSGNYLIFNTYKKTILYKDIKFKPNSEVSEIGIAKEGQKLAFPSHNTLLQEFFTQKSFD